MPNSTFAQRPFETEYPVSSRAQAHDGAPRCEPGDGQQDHMFHWLVFAPAAPAGKETNGVGCDLWRWHRGEWRSVFVAGATFTPEEMHAQGWRYCAPSVQLFVKLNAASKERGGERDQADVLPTYSAMVPPKRKRGALSLAASAPPPAWPRQAGPMRRGAVGSI